ncbi:hypothetical protein CHS0354_022400 [Potamilus streckersoni]|uniref:Nucleoporin NDC1 n=1 Tax=Potamilus streckersoni TaxID=2493646 RepID=A0AAE0SXF4_9BIVA|nr:hypothetical protein CHS0354_022400 [Potamilus streckersoni]
METLAEWFTREVFRWRTGAAITWTVIMLCPLTTMYLLLASFHPSHPFQWITDFLFAVISLHFIMSLTFLSLISVLFHVISSRTFTVVPYISLTRLAAFLQLCKAQCLTYGTVCAVTGGIIAWTCTCMLGGRYANLSFRCDESSDAYCLNEYHLFLVLYGIYTGLFYFTRHYLQQQNYMQFPALQQAKVFQVRSQIVPLLYSTLGYVLWQIKFFYILYYFFGYIPRNWMSKNSSLKLSTVYSLDTLYGLLDVVLLWQTFWCGVFIQYPWSLGATLFKIYNTEHFEFPVTSMFDSFKNKCLVDALNEKPMSLLQYLGFHDLCHLSKHSFARRKELFSLSQPGGHPHNWNKVLSVCLSVIIELNDKVQEANWLVLSSAPIRQPSGDKPHPSHNRDGQTSSLHIRSFHQLAPITTIGDETGKTVGQSHQKQAVTFKTKLISNFKKRPIISYFLGELPEARSRQIYVGAQIQIWAVEALSSLTAASYQEDSYGVVQMSLPKIITAMLSLQENIDRHLKTAGGPGRKGQKDQTANYLALRYLLQNTLKSSIYRIIDSFGKCIIDLRLPADVEKKIKSFMDYKE